jgi:hypothetical protein
MKFLSWDSEVIIIDTDDISNQFNGGSFESFTSNLCGQETNDEVTDFVKILDTHTSNTLNLKISNTLDQGDSD